MQGKTKGIHDYQVSTAEDFSGIEEETVLRQEDA
jgi:hypothetical protein